MLKKRKNLFDGSSVRAPSVCTKMSHRKWTLNAQFLTTYWVDIVHTHTHKKKITPANIFYYALIIVSTHDDKNGL